MPRLRSERVKGVAGVVPVGDVCPSAGAPQFSTPDAAMRDLAAAWDRNDDEPGRYLTSVIHCG